VRLLELLVHILLQILGLTLDVSSDLVLSLPESIFSDFADLFLKEVFSQCEIYQVHSMRLQLLVEGLFRFRRGAFLVIVKYIVELLHEIFIMSPVDKMARRSMLRLSRLLRLLRSQELLADHNFNLFLRCMAD